MATSRQMSPAQPVAHSSSPLPIPSQPHWPSVSRVVRKSLTGHIPAELAKLHLLIVFILSSDNLEGSIPESLSILKSLFELDLSSNHLTGHILGELTHLPNLTILVLSSNNLEGPIPQSLSLLKSLGDLDIGSNSLEGPIWLLS